MVSPSSPCHAVPCPAAQCVAWAAVVFSDACLPSELLAARRGLVSEVGRPAGGVQSPVLEGAVMITCASTHGGSLRASSWEGAAVAAEQLSVQRSLCTPRGRGASTQARLAVRTVGLQQRPRLCLGFVVSGHSQQCLPQLPEGSVGAREKHSRAGELVTRRLHA